MESFSAIVLVNLVNPIEFEVFKIICAKSVLDVNPVFKDLVIIV